MNHSAAAAAAAYWTTTRARSCCSFSTSTASSCFMAPGQLIPHRMVTDIINQLTDSTSLGLLLTHSHGRHLLLFTPNTPVHILRHFTINWYPIQQLLLDSLIRHRKEVTLGHTFTRNRDERHPPPASYLSAFQLTSTFAPSTRGKTRTARTQRTLTAQVDVTGGGTDSLCDATRAATDDDLRLLVVMLL